MVGLHTTGLAGSCALAGVLDAPWDFARGLFNMLVFLAARAGCVLDVGS